MTRTCALCTETDELFPETFVHEETGDTKQVYLCEDHREECLEDYGKTTIPAATEQE